jgi:hypothetical protein
MRRRLYREHLISSYATADDSGSYRAHAAIAAVGLTLARAQRFIDLEGFSTEAEAVSHAEVAAIDWLDHNGAITPSSAALLGRHPARVRSP